MALAWNLAPFTFFFSFWVFAWQLPFSPAIDGLICCPWRCVAIRVVGEIPSNNAMLSFGCQFNGTGSLHGLLWVKMCTVVTAWRTKPPQIIRGLPTFVGYCLSLSPVTLTYSRLVTKHMSLAYRNMFYPMKHLASTQEAKILTGQLNDKSTADTPAERRNRTREMLVNGELKRRGLYTEEELRYLIELVEGESELRSTAALVLAHFLHNTPSEFTLSTASIASAVAKSTGLAYMLDEAEAGTLNLFKEIKPTELVMGAEIGSGTEASVFKATWEGKDVAVKRFRGIPSTSQFQREVSIMSLVQHPNLLRCYGGYSDTKKDEYFLVMDLMVSDVHAALHSDPLVASRAAGSASPPPQQRRTSRAVLAAVASHTTIDGKRVWNMGYPQILKLALQTARGMEYLHDCNLIHRDLKSVNLLMDDDFNAKVCDFGLSRIIAPKTKNMTGNVGTVSWIAPEVFEKQPYDAKADVYSFGVVMWELYTRQIPFQDMNTFEIPTAVIKGDRPAIPKDCPKEYAKLMQLCWSKKPAKRPTFAKIVKSLLKISKDFGMDSPLAASFSGSSISSPAPLLHRNGFGQSQSASAIIRPTATSAAFAKDPAYPLNFSTSSLEESVTTSSSNSNSEQENGAPAKNTLPPSSTLSSGASSGPTGRVPSPLAISGPILPPSSASSSAAGAFPRRRTASSAASSRSLKTQSSPHFINPSIKNKTARNSTEFSQVSEVPETGAT